MDYNKEFQKAKEAVEKEYTEALLALPINGYNKIVAITLLELCKFGAKSLIVDHSRVQAGVNEALGDLVAHNVFAYIGREKHQTFYDLNPTQFWI